MDNLKFEELLRKDLSIVEETVSSDFRKSSYKQIETSLYFSQNFNMDFYGMYSHALSVETDKNDTVEEITIHFGKVINRQFYDLFVEKYGEPIHIYVLSDLKVVSKIDSQESNDPFHQNLTKREGDLIKGTFDDKPLFMIWEKDDFYIQAFMRYEQNISEITFSVDSPRFIIKKIKMNTMNKLKLSLSFLLLFSALMYSQSKKDKKSEIVKSFFEDVFINNKSQEELFTEYADKKGNGNSKSKDSIADMFNKCVLQLKADRGHLINKSVKFNVNRFNNCSKSDTKDFGEVDKNVFVVSVNDEIECYVLMKRSKILAFHHVTKGEKGPSYFVY
ncbi:hypothetical protein ABW636_02820 [Aquimarina sp. 2201CG1-2-11]|uniref:hypothetical protein n=1 Tax=Aquimarina discodermiae TaxID=3231043 RepID=UPI003461FE85